MIRVVYTASNTLGGKIIRRLTKSTVSHVMIQYPSQLWGGEWVAQASFPTVSLTPAERSRHNIVTEFECLFDGKFGLQGIREEIGRWYDFELLLGLGIVALLWRWLKIKVRRPFGSAQGTICSELAGKFFKASKIKDSESIDLHKFTPELSLEYTIAHPELFRQLPKEV
jgi:hypothetical protein